MPKTDRAHSPLCRRYHRIQLAALLSLLVAAAVPILFSAATSHAQTKQDGCLKDVECKTKYKEGLRLYDEGRYVEALPEFQAAYQRRQMPWLLLNIGRTLQRLGRPQEAIDSYERYLKAELNLTPETEQKVKKYIEQARALVSTTPTPPPTTTPPPTVTPTPGTGQPAQTSDPLVTPPPVTADTATKKPIYKKWWFWTIIGVVVAGGVATGVGVGLANSKKVEPEPFQPNDPIYMPTF